MDTRTNRRRQDCGVDHLRPIQESPSAPLIATWMSLFCTMLGCARTISLPPSQLPALAAYHERGSVNVGDAAGDILVEPGRAPRLDLWIACSAGPLAAPCGWSLSAPLGRLRFEPTRIVLVAAAAALAAGDEAELRFPGPEQVVGAAPLRQPNGDLVVGLPFVISAELHLRHASSDLTIDPDGHDRRWARFGIGLSLGGPGLFLSATAELHLFRYLSLEVGLMPPLAPGVVIVWAGARLISPRIGAVAIFAGGFIDGGLGGEDEHGTATVGYRGPRFGLDVLLPGGDNAVEAEFDLVQPLHSGSSSLCSAHPTNCPFGGVSFVHFLR